MDNTKYKYGSSSHKTWLKSLAIRDIDLFRRTLRPNGGFFALDSKGQPTGDPKQECFSTARIVHSFALAHLSGVPNCAGMIDHGLKSIWTTFRDQKHGGYFWSVNDGVPLDARKLNYAHVFVLLAATSAKKAGHPDADRLIDDISSILSNQFWDDGPGLFRDEFNRDWTPFSTYRGMNSNMHGMEALLNAYEATGEEAYLKKAGSIIDFFLRRIAPKHDHRLPEHYTEGWELDWGYAENPMFRPAGTTPGHSFEMARLLLQFWDSSGRPADGSLKLARAIAERALSDAWCPEKGGICYTLKPGGMPDIRNRYWWPMTEAIGVTAAFLKIEKDPVFEEWYQRLWAFTDEHFLDHVNGGWYAEIDDQGRSSETQFAGKPDIYHGLQAELLPMIPSLSVVRVFRRAEGVS